MRNDMQYRYRPMPSSDVCAKDSHMPIAMAYVPWQVWQDIYDAEKGFHRGTIFQELDKPFLGMGGCRS